MHRLAWIITVLVILTLVGVGWFRLVEGVIIVAIRRADGEIVLPPTAATVIRPDDVLIALGKVTAVSQFLSSEQLTS
ncbi:TrkA-C domain protein [Stieleria maiorica]|uniref:TrkA-C domain protein n=1 Tax=Stieleria maiorica TaxID=2795974 RepID=A0A5B9MGR8_9BACT|nr:TrkA C-terminal domain-containing protein [Stieleria maiorica]QEG00369.1 TrkA-C domain protein [Stieleria maiorica]